MLSNVTCLTFGKVNNLIDFPPEWRGVLVQEGARAWAWAYIRDLDVLVVLLDRDTAHLAHELRADAHVHVHGTHNTANTTHQSGSLALSDA